MPNLTRKSLGMHLPLEFQTKSNILVAGVGGGYDVVCALPVALSLRGSGHRVHLASYSFSQLDQTDAEQVAEGLYQVTPSTGAPPTGYFPEGYLTRWWLEQFQESISVWSYKHIGVRPLSRLFAHLVATLELDAIVLIDAGVDGLFEGTEHELGTPSIDIISILAASHITHIPAYYGFTAFGTEGRNHSVRHADALMRVSQQVALGGMRGVSALLPQSFEGKLFCQAVRFIHQASGPDWQSNMASSIVAALEGKFGHHVLTPENTESPIWVSPLTLLYWFFDLESVAQAKPFRDKGMETDTVTEMVEIIRRTRESHQVLPRLDIPV